MKVFVTGATGYVGSGVVAALLRAGHQVTGLARSDESAARLSAIGVEPLRGDLATHGVLGPAATEHDASIHVALAGGAERAAIEQAAIETLLVGAGRARGPRAVIYTSGVWTLGANGGAAAIPDEDAPVDHPAEASQHRPALERFVLGHARDNVAVAVVRPGMLYGGAGGLASFLCQWLPGVAGAPRTACFVGDGANRWMPIHRDDCGELYRLIVAKRASGIFHAVEEEPVVVAAAARALAKAGALDGIHAWPLEDARAKLGPLADALALDIIAAARRSRELGWRPSRRPFMNHVKEVFDELQPNLPSKGE